MRLGRTNSNPNREKPEQSPKWQYRSGGFPFFLPSWRYISYKRNIASQGSGKKGVDSRLVVEFAAHQRRTPTTTGGSETSGCSRSAKERYYSDNKEQTRLSITHETQRAIPSGVCYSRTLGYIIPLIFFKVIPLTGFNGKFHLQINGVIQSCIY